ncbi:hypothetical protein VAWG004_19790 [Aeromonas veronii]|nr:hypothetical protein VAWG004_19790 [Aeromonas veronii]
MIHCCWQNALVDVVLHSDHLNRGNDVFERLPTEFDDVARGRLTTKIALVEATTLRLQMTELGKN